jgi:hypothetical protein
MPSSLRQWESCPGCRLHTLLEATIIEADPLGAEQQAALAAQERFVRLGRSSDHGLKMIIARATAGDAIWFKATIDRIADILAWQGDNDPVDVRRSKAIGILAQPAQALQLLCQHQDDDWDGPAEPSDPAEEPACETEVSFDEAAHRSLQISPPPFHPDWARPRAVVYVHLSEEALSGGLGVARVEDVGPVLLNRLTPYSAITAPSTSNRSSTCPPATHRWTATKSPPGSANNSNSAARHLAMAITPPPHLPRQRQRHPTPRRHRVCTSALARRGTSAAESASST